MAIVKIEKPRQTTLTAENIVAEKPPAISSSGVATIKISGPLSRTPSYFSYLMGSSTYHWIKDDVQGALNDSECSEIFLEVDSHGGEVAGCLELADFLKQSTKIKPIKAYVVGSCESAAYWLASACTEIIASPTATVGGLGAMLTISTWQNDNSVSIVSEQTPDKITDLDSDEGKQELQDIANNSAEVFLKSVAKNRAVSIDTVKQKFGKGKSFPAPTALKNGMVDEVSTLDDYNKKRKIKVNEKEIREEAQKEGYASATKEITEKFNKFLLLGASPEKIQIWMKNETNFEDAALETVVELRKKPPQPEDTEQAKIEAAKRQHQQDAQDAESALEGLNAYVGESTQAQSSKSIFEQEMEGFRKLAKGGK